MPEMMFYITEVDNQSDAQVELKNPAKSSDNKKVDPGTTVTCNPPILVPNIMYDTAAEISVTTKKGEFSLRQWYKGPSNGLLSMLVDQGEVVLAPPPGQAIQLVVKDNGGLGWLPHKTTEVK